MACSYGAFEWEGSMIPGTCPICGRDVPEGDRLVLEYLPEHGHWMMLHLKPITSHNPNQSEHGRYPGMFMWCGSARQFEPALKGGAK